MNLPLMPSVRHVGGHCALAVAFVLLTLDALSIATASDVRAPRKIEFNDLDRLRGQWAGAGEMTWEFTGDRYRIFSGGHLVADLRIKLYENKAPREFDVWYDGDDAELQQRYPAATPYRGIYEFRGQELVRCYSLPGSDRPKAFDANQGALSTLQRVPHAKRPETK